MQQFGFNIDDINVTKVFLVKLIFPFYSHKSGNLFLQNAILYILNLLYTSLSYFGFNTRSLCSSCSPMVVERTCIHSIDLSRVFVPHSRDFLKNLGDFTEFYRTTLVVPPIFARSEGTIFGSLGRQGES